MKRLITALIILIFLFSIGCSGQQAPEAPAAPVEKPAPAEPVPVPSMTQVEHEEEDEVVAPPATTAPEPEPEKIGSRLEGTYEAPAEEAVSAGLEEIRLNPDKTMGASLEEIKVGDTLAWKNYDTWPHQLAVETGSGWDTIRHAESPRLDEGQVWEYTFEEKGEFLVRDIFSGKMRMQVIVS